MSAVTDMLTTIDSKIAELIANDQITNYRIGDKTVDRGAALAILGKLRETYQKLAEKEPYEDIRQIDYEISDLGDDLSEYIGDLP